MTEFACVCGKTFKKRHYPERHLKGKTNKCKLQTQQTTIETYNCKYCNKLFSRKYNKERHETLYCSKRDNNLETTSCLLANPGERIISSNTKSGVKHLVYSYAKATNKNISEIILEHHLEEYFIDDLQKANTLEKINTLEEENILVSDKLDKEKIITPLDKNDLQKYQPIITEPEESESQSTATNISNTTNNIKNNSSNITNNNTNNTNNTNNGIIINNINIGTLNNNDDKNNIPFVYPFGYENINFLKPEEMLEILKSVRGSEAVVDKIYSHISNQNFINQNQKKFMITVIDKDNKINPIIRYYKLEDFGMKLYQNSIELLMRIYHKCHTRLSVEHQLIILSNIKNIEEQLMNYTNHYDTYDTIITGISNNGMRRRYFTELKRKLEEEDPETTKKIKEILESQFEELAKYHEDLAKRSLTKEEIHQLVWEPAEDIPEMELYNHNNDLRLHRVIETPRYIKRKELEQDELDLIQQNGGFMGDVETIYNLRQSRNQNEATLLKESYELKPEHIEEINEVFSNKPNNMLKLQSVRLARNYKTLPGTSTEKRKIKSS